MIEAKVIADSITKWGHRLTTVEATFPRFILAEVNTHRVISKNSASSRARPATKNIEDLGSGKFVVPKFAAEQKGMQGGDEIEAVTEAEAVWTAAMGDAIKHAERLIELGVHKSVANRVLEPFMYHTAIMTATSWQNFLDLRANPLAQPEFQVVAYAIKEALEASEPKLLGIGEWHTPYLMPEDGPLDVETRLKVSVARCARVSYLTHDGKRDIDKDLQLYDRLISADPFHASPMEHVATPWPWNVQEYDVRRGGLIRPRIGNFVGWRQHRLDLEIGAGVNSYV